MAILVHEHSLGAYMSCTMTLDITSGSESAISIIKSIISMAILPHFFEQNLEPFFEIRVVVGHPKGPESAVIVLLDHCLCPRITLCHQFWGLDRVSV